MDVIVQQTERLLVLYNKRGLLAILHAAAAHCGQALTITTDEIAGVCGAPSTSPATHN